MGTYYLTDDKSVLLEIDKKKLGFEVAIYELNKSTEKAAAQAVGKEPYQAIGRALVTYLDKCNTNRATLKSTLELYERLG